MRLNNYKINLREKKGQAKPAGSFIIDLRPKAESELISQNFVIDLKPALKPRQIAKRKTGKLAWSWKSAYQFAPRLSIKAAAAVMILSLIVMPLVNIGAYEAHVINVTARIENDIPDIDPEGGQFCDIQGADVTLITTYPGATIIYTLDGTDPVCPANNPSEFNYTVPFHLAASATVKARSCHNGKQSAIESDFFDIARQYCPFFCGDGNLDPGEQCDDGNNLSGDGCSATCEKECFVEGATSSSPVLAKLNNGTIVTDKVKASDDIRAYQPITGTQYIYLNWAFGELPLNAPTTLAELTLEHREFDASISVQWWNGLIWIDVCNPPESASDLISTCNLLPYIDNTNKASDVKIRLKLTQGVACHEELDWAKLEIKYKKQVECNVCGNGILESGEQCDDGNNTSGDGCSAACQNECVPKPETCNGIDDDCDGVIDNNVYRDVIASGTPNQANLEDGTNVTQKVSLSDDIYAVQPANNHINYIYLQWYFSDLPDGVSTTLAQLLLEHHENSVSLKVQWKRSDNTWIDVCNPLESVYDITTTCDLLPYLNTTDKAKDVNLRLKMVCLRDCEEYTDWAKLIIRYREQVECPVCGDSKLQDGEECDDGNIASGDGCDNGCKLENKGCLKINEVYYYPGTRCLFDCDCENDPNDEWIELYNSCPYPVNIKDWKLSDNAEEERLNHNYPIAAHQFVVIAANASTWKYWPNIPNNAFKIALGGTDLFNGLSRIGDRVFLYDNYDNLIDSVSWGTDKSAFDPPAASVAKGHSISRKTAGVDTDKAIDWMDTFSGSTPPGPNPGTNPHDAQGNLLTPDSYISLPGSDCCASSTANETYSEEEMAQKIYLESIVSADQGFDSSSSDGLIIPTDENNSIGGSISADSAVTSASGELSGEQVVIEDEGSSGTPEILSLPEDNDTVNVDSLESAEEITLPIESDMAQQPDEPASGDQTGGAPSPETPATLPEEPVAPVMEDKTPVSNIPTTAGETGQTPPADNPVADSAPMPVANVPSITN